MKSEISIKTTILNRGYFNIFYPFDVHVPVNFSRYLMVEDSKLLMNVFLLKFQIYFL